MQKIPTLFERDWDGDRSRVVDQVHEGCEWVLAGEGLATCKLDGTSCMIRDGEFFKRREQRGDRPVPLEFEQIERDEKTGKVAGWMPVGDGPEDRWHREALANGANWLNGTYELIGPKVQGNPERALDHFLIRHGEGLAGIIEGVPRDFAGLRDWLEGRDIEGVVFRHQDGRMAKIKLRDFGHKRPANTERGTD